MKRVTLLALIFAALIVAPLIATAAIAQTLTNTFGGLSESSKDPIDIESDVLVVRDKEKYATFKGNVKAVQGTTTLRARELKVYYVGGDSLASGGKAQADGQAAPAPAPETKVADAKGEAGKGQDTQITKIEAMGEVVITSDDDQTTTSDSALYDLPAQLVTVSGNVVLTQGENVLKGDRLVIDLKTGESRFEHSGDSAAGGRIRALFKPKGGEADGTKPGDAKPAAKEAGSSGNKPAGKSKKAPEGADASESLEEPMPLTPETRF
jgi:lipopolysaccharide export system protein LptA